jgi:uroporphyrinogen decarboxylase
MTKKESFIKAITFGKCFPVPYVIRFTIEAEERYRSFLGGTFDEILDTGSYVVFSQTNSGWTEVRPGYFKDYFGVTWNKTKDRTLGIVDRYPIDKPSLKGFQFPSIDDLPVFKYIEQNKSDFPDHFHFLSIGFALFERAWSIVGMENLMLWMLMEPEFVHDLMDNIAEFNIKLIQESAKIGGLDGVRFGDDWAGQNGLLIGGDLWRQFIKPRLKRMCDAAKAENLYIGQHCCGKVESLIPDMIDVGINVFDPFQPEVMDIYDVFNSYNGQISFLGGLSIQNTLPFGSLEEVRGASYKLLEELGVQGGYIFSPSHALTSDIPPENIREVINIARNQSKGF